MRRKKNVTEAVLAANSANSKKSPGPRTEQGKNNSRLNAVRHGLLSKHLALETDAEKLQFRELVESWRAELEPDGLLESFLVEEIAAATWKLQIAIGLETRELSCRQGLRDRLRGFFDSEIDLPIEAGDLPVDRSFDCERLVIRAVAGQNAESSSASRGPRIVQEQMVHDYEDSGKHNSRSGSHLEIEAVLGNSLASITRYESSLKKDLYRAIDKLRAVQREKREQAE